MRNSYCPAIPRSRRLISFSAIVSRRPVRQSQHGRAAIGGNPIIAGCDAVNRTFLPSTNPLNQDLFGHKGFDIFEV